MGFITAQLGVYHYTHVHNNNHIIMQYYQKHVKCLQQEHLLDVLVTSRCSQWIGLAKILMILVTINNHTAI